MVYDDAAAARVRKLIGRRKGISEKKMFGGVDGLRMWTDLAFDFVKTLPPK